jgi:hypothetical protein
MPNQDQLSTAVTAFEHWRSVSDHSGVRSPHLSQI